MILGGGREHFLPSNVPDPEYPEQNGTRKDGVNLIQVNTRVQLTPIKTLFSHGGVKIQKMTNFETIGAQLNEL